MYIHKILKHQQKYRAQLPPPRGEHGAMDNTETYRQCLYFFSIIRLTEGLYTGIQVNIPVITGNCPIIVRCNDEHDFTGSYIVHTLF